MDSTHASSSTSTRASPSTSSANLIALSQEISRLGTIFNEQEFTQKEMAELRKFFTVEATQRKDILDLISTLTDDREKLNYLKEFLTEQRDADKDDLKSLIENIEGKLGDIYELSSRLEISRTQGSHYASKFEAFDLFGLIRLALPRKKLPFDNTIYDAQANLLFFRANKLANFIYEQGMRKKLEESIKYIRTLSSDKNYNKNLHALAERADFALKNFAKYEGTAKSSEKRLYLASTPELSIMLMTAYVLDAKISIENNQAPFNCRLDVDLRGRTTGTNIANITVELGEIKSSNTSTAIKKGYRQLLLRLAVLSYVIEACSNESFNFNLFGKIYVPKTDPNFQIPPEWKKGITFSNSANYYIEVITIGEKQ